VSFYFAKAQFVNKFKPIFQEWLALALNEGKITYCSLLSIAAVSVSTCLLY
jgi:hypothetical protein